VASVSRPRHALALLTQLRRLPPQVALFQWRARGLAARTGDEFGPLSATRARDLRTLLDLAHGRRSVVELGTGSAWTAISLALADPRRTVVTYDPIDRPERARYLALVGSSVRGRVTLVAAEGREGPREQSAVDLLYIDSAHDEQGTIGEVEAWRASLAEGALIVFDDYTHPEYPGVRRAVERLGLRGERRGTLFVHRVGERAGLVEAAPVAQTDLASGAGPRPGRANTAAARQPPAASASASQGHQPPGGAHEACGRNQVGPEVPTA
jgi:predicted O-methyltransferase YrrM